MLEKCLTPPTLLERRCFNNYSFVNFSKGGEQSCGDSSELPTIQKLKTESRSGIANVDEQVGPLWQTLLAQTS